MFLDIRQLSVERLQFRDTCFGNMVSALFKHDLFVHKITFRKKMHKLKKIITKKHESVNNLWQILQTKLVTLLDF